MSSMMCCFVFQRFMAEINLSEELVHYFGLFLIRRGEDGEASSRWLCYIFCYHRCELFEIYFGFSFSQLWGSFKIMKHHIWRWNRKQGPVVWPSEKRTFLHATVHANVCFIYAHLVCLEIERLVWEKRGQKSKQFKWPINL